MMRIAIVTDYNNKTWVWSQNYNLYTWFKRVWVDVSLINLVSPQWFNDIPTYGINIISSILNNKYLSFGYGVSIKFHRELRKLLLREQYDVVILWHQGLAYISQTISSINQKFLIIVDDLFPLYDYAQSLDIYIYKKFLLKTLGSIKNMVFISDFTKNDYEKYYGDLEAKNSITIHIGIDTIAVSKEAKNKIMHKLSVKWKRIILNVWSEDIRKNMKTFLAIANHYKDNQDVVFVRVWRKSNESDKYIYENQLNNVIYVSWLSEEDMMALYSISYIVLSPSLLEWYGKQIFEWYHYNNFIITTKVSDVELIFKKDHNVFMINNPESVEEYIWHIENICKGNHTFQHDTEIQSLEKEADEYLNFIKSIDT